MAKTAIEAPRESIFRMLPEDITIIGIDTDDGPEHPLYDMTFRHNIHEPLVLNIMDLGVDETISVWKEQETGRILAVNGRRRILHSREANKRIKAEAAKNSSNPVLIRVPARLRKGGIDHMARLGVALNTNRMDESPITKAEKVVRMLSRNGGDYQEVAVTIGATVKTVRTYEKLMGLPSKVRNAVNGGKISASAAVKLDGLPKEEMETTLDKLIAEGGGKKVSTSAVTRKRKEQNGKAVAPRKSKLKKLVKAYTTADEKVEGAALTEEFIRGVQFAIGELDPTGVNGLKQLLDEL